MRGRDVLMLLFFAAAVQRLRTPPTVIVLPQVSREPRARPASTHPSFSSCPRCGTEAQRNPQKSFWCRPCDRAFYPDFGALVSSL